jgi:hypothetical protein
MVLRAMETVLNSHIHELDKDTANIVIFLASSEMTKTKVWVWEGSFGNGACVWVAEALWSWAVSVGGNGHS